MTTQPTIRTVEQLRASMAKVSGKYVPDDKLVWFVCIENARAVSEAYSLKDFAHMFNDGIKAINSLQDVEQWLNQTWEDYDEETGEENPTDEIEDSIRNFYGK